MMAVDVSKFVNAQRLWERHMEMAQYGRTPQGGVNRQALSTEDAMARRVLVTWAELLGLTVGTDVVGNLFMRLQGTNPEAAPVVTGSHIDSQPTGGRFDGVYGVLAGLEAIQAIREAGIVPKRSLELAVWMNEEGSRFAPGMMGSSVFSGSRTLDSVLSVIDAQGISVGQALEEIRNEFPDIPLWPLERRLHAYIEAHIEQGPVLEREGITIGVVTGIQGKRTFRVSVSGEEAHAGTAARSERRDALLAAVELIQAIKALCEDDEDLVKFTVGRLDVKPNAPSVVPAEAVFSIDLRHPDSSKLQSLGDQLLDLCAYEYERCAVSIQELSAAPSLEFPDSIRSLIRRTAEDQSISCMDILSKAGHDARYLHYVCDTGMIFIPCKDGISHNEAESATERDLADGARVLVGVLLGLST
ncbi:M20 family metallo-hydrolase [Castellaniella sp. S9]|uniref:M20 family metallo-hydrolase n=1 Tax=Castellaniella sp. S9 TaxID=2993652 RepID=UPI0022B3C12C|nr:M20 family metallo-hydrolase [Castellaniella sp. S9]